MASLRSRNDVAATSTTRRFRTPPESRPRSLDAASTRSWQRAPRPVAQFFETKDSLHSLPGGRKLPGGIVLDAFVLANLSDPMQVALDAALRIRSVFERRAELFLLLLAMRTPICAIHFYATILQAAREAVMLVLGAVAEIVS